MKKLIILILLMIGISVLLNSQNWIRGDNSLKDMFTRMADGIVYCHSDRSKTTGVVIKKTKIGSWVLTAGHKADRDFPQSSRIDVKLNRHRETRMYISLENSIIVPEDRSLDLMLFFVEGLKTKYVFKKFRTPIRYEENWIFGFRGGAGKVPGSSGYITEYFTDRKFVFTSASLWYGCSGAPVVTREGEIIGLAVRMANQSTDGLIISGESVNDFIKKALKNK